MGSRVGFVSEPKAMAASNIPAVDIEHHDTSSTLRAEEPGSIPSESTRRVLQLNAAVEVLPLSAIPVLVIETDLATLYLHVNAREDLVILGPVAGEGAAGLE
jgi:hypothetical protein